MLLPGFALGMAPVLVAHIQSIVARAPFRHMVTPGGARMAVAMTNCGEFGWVTDRGGYRYVRDDPLTGRAWPALPADFAALADAAATAAGFGPFVPDACLVNRYVPGTRLSLHQDRDERDLSAPIVSSTGAPHRTGGPSGSPITAMSPPIACTSMSTPGLSRHGPSGPNADSEQ